MKFPANFEFRNFLFWEKVCLFIRSVLRNHGFLWLKLKVLAKSEIFEKVSTKFEKNLRLFPQINCTKKKLSCNSSEKLIFFNKLTFLRILSKFI